MTPDEALLEVLHQRPKSVVIISEAESGELRLTVGPDMSMAGINLLLDQAKGGVLKHTMQQYSSAPIVGFESERFDLAALQQLRKGEGHY